MPFCRNCGTSIAETGRFCTNCGQPTDLQTTSQFATSGNQTQDREVSNRTTLNSLVQSDSLLCAPVLEEDLPGILYWVGESPLPVSGPTGFAMMSSMGSDKIMVFCWDRRPQKMIPTQSTGMFNIKKQGGKWTL